MKAARMHEYGKPARPRGRAGAGHPARRGARPGQGVRHVPLGRAARSTATSASTTTSRRRSRWGTRSPASCTRSARRCPKAAGLQEGDHVAVAPGWGDGVCRHCLIGNTHICPNVRWPGFGPHGGFAEFLPVPARYLVKADPRLEVRGARAAHRRRPDALSRPQEAAGRRRARPRSRARQSSASAASAATPCSTRKLLGGGATVVAFARNADKLAVAKEYGVDHAIAIKGKSAADVAKELEQGDRAAGARCDPRLHGRAGDDSARLQPAGDQRPLRRTSAWSAIAWTSRSCRASTASRHSTARTGATTPT